MMITPTGIKISFGGRSGDASRSRPVVARIQGFPSGDKEKPINREMVIRAGTIVEEELPEGLYNVQITLPSGRILQRNVKIDEMTNETYEFLEDFAPGVGFSLQESTGRDGKEILAEAVLASSDISAADHESALKAGVGSFELESLIDSERGEGTTESPPQDVPQLALRTGLPKSAAKEPPDASGWNALPPNEFRGDCALWQILNTNDVPRSKTSRHWARIELPDGRIELASVPQPWFCTAKQEFTPAEILVDPARSDGAATTVAVHDSKLAGLLAYLDRGQAGAARPLLEDIESENLIEQTIHDTKSNSLAACAAAYVGLSVYPPNEREQWDAWLQDCMAFFPGVPDAAIVHARRLLLRPDNSGSNEDAADALRKAAHAGPPYFSAGVSLLREMLLLLSADHKDLVELAEEAAELSARVDPTQVFTVLRYAAPDSR